MAIAAVPAAPASTLAHASPSSTDACWSMSSGSILIDAPETARRFDAFRCTASPIADASSLSDDAYNSYEPTAVMLYVATKLPTREGSAVTETGKESRAILSWCRCAPVFFTAATENAHTSPKSPAPFFPHEDEGLPWISVACINRLMTSPLRPRVCVPTIVSDETCDGRICTDGSDEYHCVNVGDEKSSWNRSVIAYSAANGSENVASQCPGAHPSVRAGDNNEDTDGEKLVTKLIGDS